MKRIKILLILLAVPLALFSQGREVSGKVSDESGETLIGANVIIKGTTAGSITNVDGNFSLIVPDPETAVLVFSYVGYLTQEIPVGNSTVIDVVLTAEAIGLDEVVVTALGINREAKSLVYARQGVDADDLKEARSTNVLNSLAGRAAGVQVMNSTTPTGSNRVVIRGVTSLVGSNQPLYVIDGVALDNSVGDGTVGTWTNADQQIDFGDPMSNINPDDIENIEVLKGANAAALYGSRAANGVILITTKKGKTDNAWGVSLNSNTMFTEFSQLSDKQYVYGSGAGGSVTRNAQGVDPVTGLANVNQSGQGSYGSPLLGFDVLDFNGEIGQYSAQTNNETDLYKPAWSFTNGFSLDKSSDVGSIRVGYTNLTSDWMMKGQEKVRRNNISFRGTRNLSDKLEVDASILYTHEKVINRVSNAGSVRNPALSVIHQHPNQGPDNLIPWKDESGNAPSTQLFWFTNPYWLLNEEKNEDVSDRIIGNLTVNYEILPGLNLRGRMMGDVRLVQGWQFANMGAAYDRDGMYRNFNQSSYNWNFEGIATYYKKFGDISVNAMAGGNAYIRQYERRRTDVNTLLLPDVPSATNNGDIALVYQNSNQKRINSAFGSASFGWRDLIFVDVTARNDWSSTLPEANNSYFYPSVGTSFIFSELIPKSDVFSYGKIRASWAKVGNDANPYQVFNTYSYAGTYRGMPKTQPGRVYKNPDLKNEETNSLEVGLEAGFIQNRISLNLSYYNTSSVNQIIQVGLSPASGYDSRVYNAGEITNKGIEVMVGGKILTGDFQWDLNLNWSMNKSMVESLYPGIDRYALNNIQNATKYAEVGSPFGVMYGRVQVVDSVTGQGLVNGLNGVQIYEGDTYMGGTEPKFIGGVSNSFRWKGFNLNFLIDFRKGGGLYSWTTYRQGQYGIGAYTLEGRDEYLMSNRILGENNNERRGVGLYDNAYNRGDRAQGALYPGVIVQDDGTRKPNDAYIDPNTYFFQQLNDMNRIFHDASYIKLREVILGYSLPPSLLSNSFIRSVRISLVARNPFILFQNTPRGLDPESHTQTDNGGEGLDFGSFLPTRNYGFNINLSF